MVSVWEYSYVWSGKLLWNDCSPRPDRNKTVLQRSIDYLLPFGSQNHFVGMKKYFADFRHLAMLTRRLRDRRKKRAKLTRKCEKKKVLILLKCSSFRLKCKSELDVFSFRFYLINLYFFSDNFPFKCDDLVIHQRALNGHAQK